MVSILSIIIAVAFGFLYFQNRKTNSWSSSTTLFEQSLNAIAIHDNGSIVQANSTFCSIFGYSPEEIDSFHILEFICHEFRNLVIENFNSEKQKKYFVLGKRKNGEKIHLECLDIPYNPKLTISFIQDITNLKKVEKENEDLRQQVVQNEKLASMGSLISSVIHELNTPLTAVSSFAEILNDPDIPNKENIPSKLINAAKKMKHVTEQLRQVSRSSKYDQLKPVDVNLAIQSAIDIFETQFSQKEITIDITPSDSPAMIWGNQNQIESVFQNLLANSRDAFDDIQGALNKTIIITSRISINNNFHIEYIDNAGGMPHEIIKQLFTPFFTTKSRSKGTGLGMSITKSIVEKHKGVISAASIQEEGTTFNLVFPTINDSSTPTKNLSKINYKKISTSNLEKMSLLIIDDQSDIIEVLEIYLEQYFNITGSTNSFTAIDKIKTKRFDLIITDLQMPHHSGLDIISTARAFQPQTPVIVISGHSGDCEKANIALNKGADLIIPKPFESKDDLLNQIFGLVSPDKKLGINFGLNI